MLTIAQHNRTRSDGLTRKADYIVGITLDGAFYCSDCVANTPAEPYPGPYGPNVVLSGSEYDLTCDECFREVN